MASPIHPFEIIGYIILAIVIILFTACAVVLILYFVSVCCTREKATQQAQAPADDTDEARLLARKTAIKKAADDRLAELQHRRDLEEARADGWNQAHVAINQERERLEADAAAGRKAVQELAAILARDEAEGAADKEAKQEQQRRTALKVAGNTAVEGIMMASAQDKARGMAIKKAEQKLQHLMAEGKSDRKAEQELQSLKDRRFLARHDALCTGRRKKTAAEIRGKPWDKNAEQQLQKLEYPDTDSEGEEGGTRMGGAEPS